MIISDKEITEIIITTTDGKVVLDINDQGYTVCEGYDITIKYEGAN